MYTTASKIILGNLTLQSPKPQNLPLFPSSFLLLFSLFLPTEKDELTLFVNGVTDIPKSAVTTTSFESRAFKNLSFMALEQQLSLGPNLNPVDSETNGVDARPASTDGGDDGSKAPRHPRWTRQEILVLIQGKRDAENRFRRGRSAGLAFGSGQVEPKWASVSSYCKKHGVNRGPVQCRKRWSNLAGDYKKIKEWESQIREETESFWVMRNDLRRERKLPGFF